MNHIGQTQTQMAVILNDNEMSISRSVGAMANYLGRMRAFPPDSRRSCSWSLRVV